MVAAAIDEDQERQPQEPAGTALVATAGGMAPEMGPGLSMRFCNTRDCGENRGIDPAAPPLPKSRPLAPVAEW